MDGLTLFFTVLGARAGVRGEIFIMALYFAKRLTERLLLINHSKHCDTRYIANL